ncbi:hypothetical protein VPH35_069482 [Triticum aestivum]
MSIYAWTTSEVYSSCTISCHRPPMGMRVIFTFPIEHTPSGLHVQRPPPPTTAASSSGTMRWADLTGAPAPWRPSSARTPSRACTASCSAACSTATPWTTSAPPSPIASSEQSDSWSTTRRRFFSDIRTGSLSGRIMHAPLCDVVVQRYLRRPDPMLADEVALECAASSWDGIVARLWPRARCALTIVTSSMVQYISILQSYCEIATLDDDGVSGEMKLVDLVDVKIGRSYKLVVTTYAGLYRYRVGDLLTVSDFYNATMLFLFSGHHDVILSIDHEKISEEELLRAISQAIELHLGPLEHMLSGSTAFADISKLTGHYVLFWEITNARSKHVVGDIAYQSVMENCCSTIEECFGQMYCKFRQHANITTIEIRVLEQAAFDALMDFFVSREALAGQYKTPTAIWSIEGMMVLGERVVARFFSKENPRGSLYDNYVKK